MTPGVSLDHRADADVRPDGSGGTVGSVVRLATRVLVWAVLLACVAAIAVAVVVPRLGGATPYTVLTGSMRPHLPPGTLVVVRPVAFEDLHLGSVITYQLRSGEPEVVTHRVVAVRTSLRGEVELQTRGDANGAPDEVWVRPEQVRGELWYAVPHLGGLNTLVTGHERQLVTYVVAGGLAGYALLMFAGAARDRSRRRSPS